MTHNGRWIITLQMAVVAMILGGARPDAADPAGFPERWIGTWSGTCRATRPDGSARDFAMELEIRPTQDSQRLTWRIIYGVGESRQVRDYELLIKDRSRGHYVIDEKNSILIDSFLIGEVLWSQYSVGEALITVSYQWQQDHIRFQLLSAELLGPQRSGGKEVPEVLTYPVTIAQEAMLHQSTPKERPSQE